MQNTLTARSINASAVAQLRVDYDDFVMAYKKVYGQYQLAAKAAGDAGDKVNEAKIDAAQEQVEDDFDDLKKLYQKTVYNVETSFDAAGKPANYQITYVPTEAIPDADAIFFEIKVGKQDAKESDLKQFTKTLWVRGGPKFDFSVGFVANFISDDQYFLNTEGKLQLRDKGPLSMTPTVAPIMHVYQRRCEGLAIGGMFGINAGFKELTDIKLGFLAGLSAIIGKTQKCFVSAGLSYVQVNRLKAPQYSTSIVYKDVKDFKIDDVTERVLCPTPFVAFSYSISKRAVIKPAP